ncbi:MAG TPA: hypothetical protein VKB38_14760 [Terracidiphilus sp.]|nr:hypothetical protein [Terracidiphilus sp.]
MDTTLIVRGTLRGMGCQVECELHATVSRAVRSPHPVYTRCVIVDAPGWLPDGYYEVAFHGQSAFLHREGGYWGIGIPWPQLQSPLPRAA